MENTKQKFNAWLPPESEISQTINQYCNQLIKDSQQLTMLFQEELANIQGNSQSSSLITQGHKEEKLNNKTRDCSQVKKIHTNLSMIQQEFQQQLASNASVSIKESVVYLILLFHQLHQHYEELIVVSEATSYQLPKATYKQYADILNRFSGVDNAHEIQPIPLQTTSDFVHSLERLTKKNASNKLYQLLNNQCRNKNPILIHLLQQYKAVEKIPHIANASILYYIRTRINNKNNTIIYTALNDTIYTLLKSNRFNAELNYLVIKLLRAESEIQKQPLDNMQVFLGKHVELLCEKKNALKDAQPLQQVEYLKEIQGLGRILLRKITNHVNHCLADGGVSKDIITILNFIKKNIEMIHHDFKAKLPDLRAVEEATEEVTPCLSRP